MAWKNFLLAGMAALWIGSLPLLCYAREVPKGNWQPELRVGISGTQKTVTFQANMDGKLASPVSPKENVSVRRGESVTVMLSGREFQVKGKKLSGEFLDLRPLDPRELGEMITRVHGTSYRGGIRLRRQGDAMKVINLLPAESYLRGVLPEEMPASWEEEALKVQAVAARTFALKNRKRHEEEGFDLCDTTHCQLYTGTKEETPRTDSAIKATYGEVLVTKKGEALISAVFHTDSGGMTENSEDVWGTHSPYLRAVKELKSETHPWSKTVSLDSFQSKFNVGRIKDIVLSPLTVGKGGKDRTSSGRVKTVRVLGRNGSKMVSGADMRSLFGLKSTLFSVKLTGKQVVFSGFGWGHGLGMSQWGAKAFAGRGDDYRKILFHYYQNTAIKKLY